MSELMLVNPRKRRKRRSMTAKQRKYFGKRRRTRRTTSVAAARNPTRRRRRRVTVRGRRNPTAPAVRRARRRSMGGGRGFKLIPANLIRDTVVPSAIGGAGALAVDLLWNMAPLPAAVKSGPLSPIAKAAGALAVGAAAGMVAGRRIGEKVTAGYLTVLAYNLLKGLAQKTLPALPLNDYDMGYVSAGQFIPDASMGVYLSPPAPTVTPVMASQMNEYLNGDDGFF